jgi:hypothetical protein
MDELFASTYLPNCVGDWCVDVLVSQFLINHRKYLARARVNADRAIAALKTQAETEAAYWAESGEQPDGERDVTTLDGYDVGDDDESEGTGSDTDSNADGSGSDDDDNDE